MKPISRIIPIIALLTLSLLACIPLTPVGTPVTPIPMLSLQPIQTGIFLTATPQPTTATFEPTVTANSEPVFHTQDVTNVRLGPGMSYGIYYVLPANTTVPIIGSNLNNTWWAIPGPGDGNGPNGWVSAAVVIAQGDISNVPYLIAPTLTSTPALALMGNSGPPSIGDACIVSHPGPGVPDPLYVYDGPNEFTSKVAELGLGRWVVVIGQDNGWYRIQDASNTTGWIQVTVIAHNGNCQSDDGPGSLPLIEDPGSPPADQCIAHRPGQFPPPDIHLGPGRQFALIARLGNWAEVLKTEAGWHQILLGPSDVGWINAEDVDLTGPCESADSVSVRIRFAAGETSAMLNGTLEPPQRDFYLFQAFAGQRTTIGIVSESNRANFAISGMSDSQPYKRVEDELYSWSAVLPKSQDYLLTIAAPADANITGYTLTIHIEPIN